MLSLFEINADFPILHFNGKIFIELSWKLLLLSSIKVKFMFQNNLLNCFSTVTL